LITDIKAKVDQVTPDVLDEGNMDYPRMSKLGQLWTADWKYKMVCAGKAYRLSWGTISGSTAPTMVGAGTVTDLDIPLVIVAVDTGYLIPMDFNIGIYAAMATANDETDIIVCADRATAVSAAQIATSSATAETPDNLLDGGPAFTGRAVSVCTVAITDPVNSDILYYAHFQCMGTAVNTVDLTKDKSWDYPNFLAGPCSLLVYTGGVDAVTSIGSIVFAHVPSSWVPVS